MHVEEGFEEWYGDYPLVNCLGPSRSIRGIEYNGGVVSAPA